MRTTASTLAHRLAARLRRGPSRGFTLAEMLAVIVVIGILAVAASPLFVDMMRDRRVNRAAMQIADTLRTARSRALGRGIPVLVRWDRNGGFQKGASGLLTMREPIVRVLTDASTCLSTAWTDPTLTHEVMRFDLGNGMYERADVHFFGDSTSNTSDDIVEVCFNARGRTFMRTTGAFAQLTAVPVFRIENSASKGGTGRERLVFLPPNGMARFSQ